jgi:Tfp pilus assembly ATPase PilU
MISNHGSEYIDRNEKCTVQEREIKVDTEKEEKKTQNTCTNLI